MNGSGPWYCCNQTSGLPRDYCRSCGSRRHPTINISWGPCATLYCPTISISSWPVVPRFEPFDVSRPLSKGVTGDVRDSTCTETPAIMLRSTVYISLIAAVAAQSVTSPTPTSTGVDLATITAVTSCHAHGTVQYCMHGTNEYEVLATVTATEEAPASYTGCHAHGSSELCV